MAEPLIPEILQQGFRISVELVPSMLDREGHPSFTETMATLIDHVRPSFISVTQGASGSSREQSPHVLRAIEPYNIPRCAHLICGYAPRAEVLRHAANLYALGVRNFLVLKGDRPKIAGSDTPAPESDYLYASDCIRELRDLYPDARLGGGAYPDAPAFDRTEVLAQKFSAGAHFAITQMCFNVDTYKQLAREFPDHPILPGLCFIHDREHAKKFAARFGVEIPGVPDIPELIAAYRKAGAPGVHLFLLNDLKLVRGSILTDTNP